MGYRLGSSSRNDKGIMSVVISVVQKLRFIIILIISLLSAGSNAQLHYLSNCICPGYVITYECTVFGDGFTVWQGSAFDCPLSGNEILLSHNNFEDGTVRTCNDGAIVGRSVRIMDNYYTSQLAISFTTGLDGRTIECMRVGGTTSAMTIGSSMLLTTTDPLPSPSDVRLLSASPNSLTFKWSSVATNCFAVHYIIESDCGTCLNTTSLNSVDCTIRPITTSRSCEFAVKSVVCGNTIGNSSNVVSAILKVPESPVITRITSIYSGDTQKRLLNLNILFSEVDSFMISGEVDGSPLYYAVTYFDASQNNTICGSDTISSSSCQQGVCSSSLPLSCYENNGPINASIIASNMLGNGLTSFASIGTKNEFVDVKFESATSVVCDFHNEDGQNNKVCAITFGQCQQPLNISVQGVTTHDLPNTVILELPIDLESYCYLINATNGTFNVLIEGSYTKSASATCTVGVSTSRVIIAIVLTFIMWPVLYILWKLIFCYFKRKRLSTVMIRHRGLSRTLEVHPLLLELNETDESAPMIIEFEQTNLPKEPITAHVSFEIDDKPWALMHTLESFKNINIMNIKLSPSMESRTRKVYVQCESGLSLVDRENLRNCQSNSGMMNVQFHSPALLVQQGDTCGNKPEPLIGYKYTRSLPTRPGSLYELLKSIYDLSRENPCYRGINITDITFRPSEAYPKSTVVAIWFVSELPKNWRNEFDGKSAFLDHESYRQQLP